jgi:raffinose/stachyose/melibiose transport system permease protein
MLGAVTIRADMERGQQRMISRMPRALRVPRGNLADLVYLVPVLVLLGGFLFYPLVYGIGLSLHDGQGADAARFVGMEHFARAVLGDAVFHRSLLNTVLFTGAAVVLQTGIGFLLAVLVSGVRRGRTILLVAFFAPFVLASVAVGAVWKFLYAPFFGVAATVGAALGIDASAVAPLADERTALLAVLATFLWRFTGFSMVVYSAAIRAVPREYDDVATLEGASWSQQVRRVTWPLVWPQTFALVLLTTLGTLRIFDMVWVMTAGGPAHASETVATYVYTTAFRFGNLSYAQAMAMILLAVILILTVVEYRLLNPRAEEVSE